MRSALPRWSGDANFIALIDGLSTASEQVTDAARARAGEQFGRVAGQS